MELVDFHADERHAQQERDAKPELQAGTLAVVQRDHRHARGQAAEQQQEGLDQDVVQLEQFLARRAACHFAAQHRERGEQPGKDDAVAHQVHPETKHRVGAGVVMGVIVRMIVRVGMRLGGAMRGITL